MEQANNAESPAVEPEQLARQARLRYVRDSEPGFGRRKRGSGFQYIDSRGRGLKSPRKLERIEALVIPPAWHDVWICRFANGHLQCTGRDEQGRKQYLYHERWQATVAAWKFRKLRSFGQRLAKLRRRVESDLRRRSKSSEQVAAVIVALLDRTAIRVGNEEYVRENGSYGLTTLRRRHVKIVGDRIRLRFRGKSGVRRDAELTDPRLAKLLADYQACGGAMLFACLPDESGWQLVDSDDVNAYLHAVIGEGFTAKDFRTWQASATVAGRLHASLPVETKRQRREAIRSAIGEAAELLGNTTTVCRNSYVHPELLARYETGEFDQMVGDYRPRKSKRFSREERVLLRFLQRLQQGE